MFGVRGAQWATAKRTRTATARRPSRGLSGRPALPLQTHDESLVAGVKPTPWTLPPRFIYAERSPKRNAPSEAITIWLKNRRRQGEYKHDMRVIDGLDRIMKRYAPVPPAERVEGYKFLNAFTLAPPRKVRGGQTKPHVAPRVGRCRQSAGNRPRRSTRDPSRGRYPYPSRPQAPPQLAPLPFITELNRRFR
jgi:hypothetical protein